MKTSKSNSKPKKSSENKEQDKSNIVIINKSEPGEEEIREKAEEFYHMRIARGEHGTAENDWFEAEEYLKDQKC
jgi:actin-related protein